MYFRKLKRKASNKHHTDKNLLKVLIYEVLIKRHFLSTIIPFFKDLSTARFTETVWLETPFPNVAENYPSTYTFLGEMYKILKKI